jgi:hypothetical protein
MDDQHAQEHQKLADLEALWALAGSVEDALLWRVAIRVHLAECHGFEQTRDPEGDHARLHGLEQNAHNHTGV